jgi:translation initiation factor IF-3
MAHTELGRKILDRLVDDLKELATVDSAPKQDGRNMIMVIAPVKKQPVEKQPVEKPEPDRTAAAGPRP